MPENFQIRDVFNPRVITRLAEDLRHAWSGFQSDAFLGMILPNLAEMTYSERSKAITHALKVHLPADFPDAAALLVRVLPPPLKGEEEETYDRFIIAPQTAYISRYGMEHFEVSIRALYEMTKRFTAEWDIRHFIDRYPEKTLAVLAEWAEDENLHVRRLVSEGSRPRLPWGTRLQRFIADPRPAIVLLEKLKTDPSLYVRRSVANHLNDIAKDHPDLLVNTLERWKNEHASPELDWLIKHALRTLVKDGHPGALQLLGFEKGALVTLENFRLQPETIQMGEHLTFSFTLVSTAPKPQKLVVDYVVYFMKANGSLAPKVFKLTTTTLAPGESKNVEKRHPFRKITTREYYPGEHRLAVQVNGTTFDHKSFLLL